MFSPKVDFDHVSVPHSVLIIRSFAAVLAKNNQQ